MPTDSSETTAPDPAGRPSADVVSGDRLDRYVLGARLGAGGMGVVHSATDPSLGREVAIKLLHAKDDADGRARARFVREARALAALDHPNIISILDFGTAGRRLYIVMPRIDGTSLGQYVRTNEVEHGERLRLLDAAGRGLHAAHVSGLTHRDFKPSNVLVDTAGNVFVCDFGLAAHAQPSSTRSAPADPESHDRPKSEPEQRVGTLKYMAPEQHDGGRADARSDQFAFCVTAWVILTGSHPYSGTNDASLRASKLRGPQAGDQLGRATRRVLTRGLAPAARERWSDMEALLQALRSTPKPRKRWFSVAGVSAAAAALAATTVGSMADAEPCPLLPVSVPAGSADEQPAGLPRSIATSLRRYAERDANQVRGLCQAWHADPNAAAAAMACIRSEHRQFEELHAALERADPDTLDRAAAIARDVAKSRQCALERIQGREELAAVQAAIAEARVMFISGDVEDARRALSAARARAEATGDPSLLARADLVLSELEDADGIGPTERAARMWSIAAGAYVSDDPDFAATGQLAAYFWAACQDPKRAVDLEARTAEAVARTGPDPETNVIWHGAQVRAAMCRGDLDRAIEIGQAGRELATAVPAVARAIVVRELVMASASRRYADATRYLDELVETTTEAYGAGHRRTAEDQLLAAEIRAAAGQRTVAPMAKQALALIAETMAADSAGFFDATQRVARVEFLTGDPDAAIERMTTALNRPSVAKMDPLAVAVAQQTLAELLLARERDALRASDLLDEALVVLVAAYGDPSTSVVKARYGRALALLRQGEHIAAEGAARQLCVDAESIAPESLLNVRYHALHGEALIAAGRNEDAVTVLAAAWKRSTTLPAPDLGSLRVATALGHAELAAGHRSRALEWLHEARRHEAAATEIARRSLNELAAQLPSSATSTEQVGSKP